MKTPAILLALFLCASAGAAEHHLFTTADGKFSTRAAVVALDGQSLNKKVMLRREDNQEIVRIDILQLGAADQLYVSNIAGDSSMSPLMLQRMTEHSRAAVRKASGASAAGEAAVEKGLRWLCSQQKPDGSWGVSHRSAMTGLTLLALAGHGHGVQSAQHGEAVKRAVAWMTKLSKSNVPPFDRILSEIPSTIFGPFEHAMAAQALAEHYSLSRRQKDKQYAIRGIPEMASGEIVEKQAPGGGWGYKDSIGYDAFTGNDLCLTCWQISALGACRDAGIKTPDSPVAFRKVAKYLASRQTDAGGFGKPDRTQLNSDWRLTGAGVCGLQVCSPASSQKVQRGALKWLSAELERSPLDWSLDCHLDTWYVNGMAYYAAGEPGWKAWNKQCEAQVLANQSPEGSWKWPNTKGSGEGAESAVEYMVKSANSEIGRTCLALLILETPLRTYRPPSSLGK